MARYQVTKKCWIPIEVDGKVDGPRLCKPGQKVVCADSWIPGTCLNPLDAAAKAAFERLPAAKAGTAARLATAAVVGKKAPA